MQHLKSSLDIKSEIYKLKLDDCCCDAKLLSDDGVSCIKVHLPILASSPLWWSDLLGDCSDDEVCVILQDWSMSDLNDLVRQLYDLEAWVVNGKENETIEIDGNNNVSTDDEQQLVEIPEGNDDLHEESVEVSKDYLCTECGKQYKSDKKN